jgi:alkanesulfonate monooxygenase SsuD/methylene tetrahydromethanopterin reductase-like flavin-dependent oxidoreductase (luciferase family)
MEFGIWSNGFRLHTTAAQTYEEDLREIVLADQLGFKVAFISDHHGEQIYVDKVDTLPVSELLMCKAAALTKQIRMGAAVKVIHLQHPVDVAIQATVSDHVIGDGRFIFGFGSGFASPMFSLERGLSYEDRHERLLESLEFIQKCWASKEPFDWNGKHWKGKGVIATPPPVNNGTIPMATATETDSMIRMAGERGYILLTANEPPHLLKRKTDIYRSAALAAGRKNPLRNIANARFIYVTDSKAKGIQDLKPAVTVELQFQVARGLFKMLTQLNKWDIDENTVTLEQLVELGWYIIGTPYEVAERLTNIYTDAGGFGTLLMITGKSWADRERRLSSMRLFMEEVAPQLRHLEPTDDKAQPAGPRCDSSPQAEVR